MSELPPFLFLIFYIFIERSLSYSLFESKFDQM